MKEKSKAYIGLAGEIGSGKETFVKLLQDVLPARNIAHQRFSDMIRETLALWHIPYTRKNAQALPVIIKNNFGNDFFSESVKLRALESNNDVVAIDGMRWFTDETMVRTLPNSIIVYITAPPEVRFERRKNANEKVGEEHTTWEKFQEEAKAEAERYIGEIGSRADYKIINDGTLDAYRAEVKKFAEEFLVR